VHPVGSYCADFFFNLCNGYFYFIKDSSASILSSLNSILGAIVTDNLTHDLEGSTSTYQAFKNAALKKISHKKIIYNSFILVIT